jgi:hypothetical protein
MIRVALPTLKMLRRVGLQRARDIGLRAEVEVTDAGTAFGGRGAREGAGLGAGCRA